MVKSVKSKEGLEDFFGWDFLIHHLEILNKKEAIPQGNKRLPSIHFESANMLVSGRVDDLSLVLTKVAEIARISSLPCQCLQDMLNRLSQKNFWGVRRKVFFDARAMSSRFCFSSLSKNQFFVHENNISILRLQKMQPTKNRQKSQIATNKKIKLAPKIQISLTSFALGFHLGTTHVCLCSSLATRNF